jgi:hypothetical protein
MAGKPNDNLIKALRLLKTVAARNERGSNGAECAAALRDVEGFLLADLKARRARVRALIGILEHAAGGRAAAPRTGRNAGRRAAAGRAHGQYASGIR